MSSGQQNLIEKIARLKVYDCNYWKEKCFGLTSESLIDRAVELKYMGGTYGALGKPTAFMCLLVKMLQISPDLDIIEEFIQNEDFKYLRALGAMYIRMTCKAEEIYTLLEPLYEDFRKLIIRNNYGKWQVITMDEFIDILLTEELVCNIALPFLLPRNKLENIGTLNGSRTSRLSLSELELGDEEVIVDSNTTTTNNNSSSSSSFSATTSNPNPHNMSKDSISADNTISTTTTTSSSSNSSNSNSSSNKRKASAESIFARSFGKKKKNNSNPNLVVTVEEYNKDSGQIKNNQYHQQEQEQEQEEKQENEKTSTLIDEETNSVEYWNQKRRELGLPILRQ